MREQAIENLITEIKRAINTVENKISEGNYSDALLRYIIFIENRSRRTLNRNLHPTDDEYRAGRLLELLSLIEYVLQTFPRYYTETEIELKYTKNKAEPQTLADLITHENSLQIVEEMKVRFKGIKGKRLKLLFIALQKLNLIPKTGAGSKFHECCKNEFYWNVNSLTAFNKDKCDTTHDKKQITDFVDIIEDFPCYKSNN